MSYKFIRYSSQSNYYYLSTNFCGIFVTLTRLYITSYITTPAHALHHQQAPETAELNSFHDVVKANSSRHTQVCNMTTNSALTH